MWGFHLGNVTPPSFHSGKVTSPFPHPPFPQPCHYSSLITTTPTYTTLSCCPVGTTASCEVYSLTAYQWNVPKQNRSYTMIYLSELFTKWMAEKNATNLANAHVADFYYQLPCPDPMRPDYRHMLETCYDDWDDR